MKVSVVICTYSPDLFDDFMEAVESVRSQTYDDVEVVAVVDGNDEVCRRVHEEYGEAEDVVIHCNEENGGLSVSRNNGVANATGDVVAFMDDDAVADPEWIEELVSVYESDDDVIAAGGRMAPRWVAGRPTFLPEEFYFLIGVTYDGFADPGDEVRNTYGSNISFRADVLDELDGFKKEIGPQSDVNLQAGETEIGARMNAEFGRGVVYDPEAVVEHKVFDYRTDKKWLADRAFWQGYSKRAMAVLAPEARSGEEEAFLQELLFESTPRRLAGLVRGPSFEKLSQLVWLYLLTALVGAGYLYGFKDFR